MINRIVACEWFQHKFGQDERSFPNVVFWCVSRGIDTPGRVKEIYGIDDWFMKKDGGAVMWYVVQVHAGMEEQIRDRCVQAMDPGTLEQCFVPYYEERKRYLGAWHTDKKILLAAQSGIVLLQEGEIRLLKNLGVDKKSLEMSTGIIVDGNVMITGGPLTGMENCIRKIDRHKRKAWLEIGMFGRTMQIVVGLEITEKRSG